MNKILRPFLLTYVNNRTTITLPNMQQIGSMFDNLSCVKLIINSNIKMIARDVKFLQFKLIYYKNKKHKPKQT